MTNRRIDPTAPRKRSFDPLRWRRAIVEHYVATIGTGDNYGIVGSVDNIANPNAVDITWPILSIWICSPLLDP